MSEKIILDAAMKAQFDAAKGKTIELHDPAGGLVGYVISPEALYRMRMDITRHLFTDEELTRAEKSGGEHSMEEVMKLVESD